MDRKENTGGALMIKKTEIIRRLKKNYTYDLKQLQRRFDIHPQTVRAYIKDKDNISKLEKETQMSFNVIDFGGGLGIDYTKENRKFDEVSYFSNLKKLIEQHGFQNKKLIMELGKYIVGECGYYTSQIIDIKNIKGKKHIVLAGGINHMARPIIAKEKHPVSIINKNTPALYKGQEKVQNETVDVEGPLCFNGDKLSWDENIEYAEVGDIVVLTQAGAYCYSLSAFKFLSHEPPQEIIIKGGASLGMIFQSDCQ